MSPVDGARFPRRTIQSNHLGRPVLAQYDLAEIRSSVSPEHLADRPPSLWRYEELLPLEHSRQCITLGEMMTPTTRQDALGQHLGLNDLWIKDETVLPTGSFKSRGMAVAVSMARELGIRRIAMPTAGNAGAALAAYAAKANIEAFVFMPSDAPLHNQHHTATGAHLVLVEGVISDCARLVQEGKEAARWFDFSTLREPYRLEGKKTMGFELAEQCEWTLPDVILYPTGGGTGLIGMWKAFHELKELGWLASDKLPRMVAVQSTGCNPIEKAWLAGKDHCVFFEGAATVASGLRVPSTTGDFLILEALRESNGTAVAVEEERILEWMLIGQRSTGLSIGPESAACIGAALKLVESGWLSPSDRVVLFNCGPERAPGQLERPDVPLLNPDQPVDWSAILTS